MRKYTLTENGGDKQVLKVPEGRHEVSYDQWKEAYQYLELAEEAKKDFENEDYNSSMKKSISSIAHLIASLSSGVSYDDLIKLPPNKLNNIFLLDFGWLSNEKPKKKFKVNGKSFNIPDFSKATAGDFMDAMDMINLIEQSKDNTDLGVIIAAVYMREGEYKQDAEKIKERADFLKKYAKMDLIYSASFFLLSSLMNLNLPIEQHLSKEVQKELQRLTSYLNVWVTILYSQVLQKVEY